MNDILMQKFEIQTILNEYIFEFSKETKKFYEENKTEIKNEINDKYNVSMKNSQKKYYVNNKEKLNKIVQDYNKKTNFKSQKKYKIENKYKYKCLCCDYKTAIITHYKIHCQTIKHQTNMKKLTWNFF